MAALEFESYLLKLMKQLTQFTGPILTPEEKEERLDDYHHELAEGRIDEELIPYLDRLNEFPFVMTTQSCSGHGEDLAEGRRGGFSFRTSLSPEDVIEHLLLPMERRFEFVQFQLAMEGGRCRYIIWFTDNVWEDKFKHFITLLEGLDVSELEKEAVTRTTPGAWSPTFSARPESQLNEDAYLAIPSDYEGEEKGWTAESRQAALEARRRKAKPKVESPKRRALFSPRFDSTSVTSAPDTPPRFTELVRKYVSEVPKEERNTVRAVRIKEWPGEEWVGERPSFKTGGVFFRTSGDLYLYSAAMGLNPRTVKAFVLHETGHGVLERMSQDDKTGWIGFWLKHKKDMPNAYARTSATEGFAESYMKYRKNPKSLKEHVAKAIAFVLGEGDAETTWEELRK